MNRLLRVCIGAAFALIIATLATVPAFTERRVVLAVGNSQYKNPRSGKGHRLLCMA
jgi:hypothetical protein